GECAGPGGGWRRIGCRGHAVSGGYRSAEETGAAGTGAAGTTPGCARAALAQDRDPDRVMTGLHSCLPAARPGCAPVPVGGKRVGPGNAVAYGVRTDPAPP